MQTLQSYIKKSEGYKAFSSNRKADIKVEGLDGFPLFQCVHMMAGDIDGITWLVCPTDEIARQLYSNSNLVPASTTVPIFLLPGSGRVLYSQWEGTAKEYEQLRCLGSIGDCRQAVVITSIRTVCSPLPGKGAVDVGTIKLKVNDAIDTMELASRLAQGNYYRSANTTMPGEFTVRGEVFDIFPYGATQPVRIYLDWDKIERICVYDPLSQQISKQLGHVDVQILMSSDSQRVIPNGISEFIGKTDYIVLYGDRRLETSFKSLELEAKTLYRKAYQQDREALRPDQILFDFLSFVGERHGSMTVLDLMGQDKDAYRFEFDGPRSYFGNFTYFKEDLTGLEDDGWDIEIFVSSEIQKKRLEQMLSDFSTIKYHIGVPSSGFAIRSRKFIVICENEIFGRRKQVVKTLQHTQSSAIDSFVELHEGDFVVHVNYGIGRFLKIDRVRDRDYIKI